MKAYVDKDLCIGCGLCPSLCPNVFEMGEEDVAVVIAEDVSEEDEDTAVQAQEECPVDAIKVED